MRATIDVVLVTYNSGQMLPRCLETLCASDVCRLRVVDNGSSDETLRYLDAQGIEPLVLSSNPGYAVAANRGASLGSADYLAFVNPDCLVPPDFWHNALRLLADHPSACVVPRRLIKPGMVQLGRQPGYAALKLLGDILFDNYFNLGLRRLLRRLPRYHDPDWFWPHGACLVMSRRWFDALGGMDESFPMYMGDVVLGRRMCELGGVILESDIDVVHLEGEGAAVSSSQRLALLNAGRTAYAERFHGAALARAMRLLAWPGFTLRRLLVSR
ncbi:glycosyltransferase family 2 protein [Thiocapsa bogorovii]|uniref:glycosyltransferase family 2 protein n=1 Tax=Thiocapsa bogorovii TaxID=521689 RepID=UPI001E64598B|nr:glycosyltransferase [Thiocapsa bogorovii]UHD14516.1 glycosyltransferase [Thiocapsa bogorovii]